LFIDFLLLSFKKHIFGRVIYRFSITLLAMYGKWWTVVVSGQLGFDLNDFIFG
jgi:hypothetical protein